MMSNLLLIDTTSIVEYDALITSLSPNTDAVLFNYNTDTFATVQTRILATKTEPTTYLNVAILQRSRRDLDYAMLTSVSPARVRNVASVDASLNTWAEHNAFYSWLETNCGTQNVDLVIADLWKSADWQYIVNTINASLSVNVRASLTILGENADYVLESDNVSLIGVYFTENVKKCPQNFYTAVEKVLDANTVVMLDASGTTLPRRDYIGSSSISDLSSAWVSITTDVSNVIFVAQLAENNSLAKTNSYLAVKSNKTGVVWGYTGSGAYGKTTITDASLVSIKRVYAGTGTFVVLKTNNTVYALGNSTFGIAGDVSASSPYSATTYTAAVPAGISDVSLVYSNHTAFCALKTDGSVVAWGERNRGGDCSVCQSLLANITKIVNCPFGNGVFIALSSDNEFVAWTGDVFAGSNSMYSTSIGNAACGGRIQDILYGSTNSYVLFVRDDGVVCKATTSYSVDVSGASALVVKELYTLPTGVSITRTETIGTGIKHSLSDGSIRYIRQISGGALISDSELVLSTNNISHDWNYPVLLQNDNVQLINTDITTGFDTTHIKYNFMSIPDVSVNSVAVYTTAAGTGALQKDGSVVASGRIIENLTTQWDASVNGVQDILSVSELSSGYTKYLTNGTINGISPSAYPNYTFFDFTVIPGKSLYLYDNGVITTSSYKPTTPIIKQIVEGSRQAVVSIYESNTYGYPLIGYYYRLNETGAFLPIDVSNGAITLTGLTNGSEYTLQIKSQSVRGFSSVSATYGPFIPHGTCYPPTIVDFSYNEATSKMEIDFVDASLNGCTLWGYQYSLDGGANYYWTNGTTSPFSILHLTSVPNTIRFRTVSQQQTSTHTTLYTNVPNTPTITSITTGSKQVSVAFTAGANNGTAITSYQYSLDGEEWVDVSQVSSPILITGLSNGVQYAVRLKAVNADGVLSAASSPSSSFTLYTSLTAPTITSIVPQYQGATVNVSNAFVGTDDGNGISVSGYQYSLDGVSYVDVSGTNTSFVISGLNNGTTYRVYVKTNTNIGLSSASSQSDAFKAMSVPETITITNMVPGNEKVIVYFTDGSNNGSPITGYKYTLDGEKYYTAVQTTSPITVYGLSNAVFYNIRFVATNEMGDSTVSGEYGNIMPFGVPFAPVVNNIIPGDGSAIVYMNTVNDNGSPVLGYKYSTGAALIDISGTTLPLTITGLVNKTVYNIRIVAYNIAGNSEVSNVRTVVVGTPTAPVITSVEPIPRGLRVFFTPGVDNNSPLTQYSYIFENAPTKINKAVGLTSPITILALNNGSPYNVMLQAVNKNGASVSSNKLGDVIPYDIPGKMTVTSVTPGLTGALVNFTPPPNNGRSITKYGYKINAGELLDASGTVPPLFIPNTPLNANYTISMVAYNLAGPSVISSASKSVQYVYLPPAQIVVSNLVATFGTLTATFTPPKTNGAPVTSYKYAINGATTYTDTSSVAVPLVITGLANNVSYNIQVVAVSAAGDSIPSKLVTKPALYTYLPPLLPVIGNIYTDNLYAKVFFTPPAIRNAPITGYKYSIDGGITINDVSNLDLTLKQFELFGIPNDVSHNLTVYANSPAGLSAPSVAKPFFILYKPPLAPIIGNVVVTATNARATFTPPTLRNAPITGYKYSLNGGTTLNDVVLDGSNSAFFITDFSYNVVYNLTLYANSPPGLSAPSAPKPFTYMYLPPLAPVIGNVLTAISFARVFFTPPATQNAAITGYKYSFNGGATLFDASGIDSSNSFAITDVQNDVSLNLTLYANSAAGLSPASVAKPIYILYKSPLAPAITTIVPSKSYARVNFTVPGIRGAPITGYKYALDASGIVKYDVSSVDISGNTGAAHIYDLSNNRPLSIILYANSGAGLSAGSAPKTFTIIYTAPAAPVISSVIASNQGGTVLFTPGNNNGAPITNYLYSFNGGTTTFSADASASPIILSGLTNDTSYNVSLIAVNEVGNSPPSAPKLFVPVYKAPAAPTIGTISTTTATTATIPFVAGASNGSPITTYMYSLNGGSLVDANTTASPIVVSGLTTNTNYTIVLVAVNQLGQSPASASKPFKTK